MKKFTVTIAESVEYDYEIEAETAEDAKQIALQKHVDEEVADNVTDWRVKEREATAQEIVL